MKELNYKIYVLKIINNEEIRYVGLTKGTLKKRLNSHKSDAKRRKNTYKDKWFIKNYNKIEIILIEENIKTLKEANEREIYWINHYKNLGYNLTNSTNGGDGANGLKKTEEQKEHLRKINLGKKLSKEHKEKISESNKGKKQTAEQILANKLRNLVPNKERSLKQSISNMKNFITKKGYNCENLTYSELKELKIKIKEIIRKEHLEKNNIKKEERKLKSIERKIKKDKIKEELSNSKKENKIIFKEDLKRIKKEILDKKIKENLIRIIEKKDGKKIYIPTMSEEIKKIISKANKGKIISENHKNNISKAVKQYWKENPRLLTQEQKDHLSEINKGKKQSKETILKRSLKTRGEGNGCAKINENEVLEIRYAIKNNTHTRKELAKKYNLDYTTVCKIINKQLWSHIS